MDVALQGALVIPLLLCMYTVYLIEFEVLLNTFFILIDSVRLEAIRHLSYQFGGHHGGAEYHSNGSNSF